MLFFISGSYKNYINWGSMQVLKRIIFAVVFAVGILFRLPAVAEDENNFEAKFTFTVNVTSTRNNTTLFKLASTGTFYIDYGDGSTGTINSTSTNQQTISHRYTSTGRKTVKLGGLATGYNTGTAETNASISFADMTTIYSISGSLGRIFPTLANGSQPLFRATFAANSNLGGEIPAELFDGITGQPRAEMFRSLFYECSKLTGSIPEDLFSGLEGTPITDMFYSTFNGCSGLTGSIPGGLFAGIKGNPATAMFRYTFSGCSGLTGFIPPELFAGINTTPTASNMMSDIFSNTTNMLTSCPTNYKKYTTGFESYFNNRVSCEPDVSCSTGYAAYNAQCYRLCSFGKKFMVSTGLSYDVFGEPEPSGNPSMHIKLGNTECYVFSKPGASSGFNFKHTDGRTYHLVGAD